jgi:putative restriction endonuclease
VDSTGVDTQFWQAAFDDVNRLAAVRDGIIDSADLAAGFEFGGKRIPLVNPQRGIFKPRQVAGLLSIGTVLRSFAYSG